MKKIKNYGVTTRTSGRIERNGCHGFRIGDESK